ncbi:MAG TPA: TonB-dependent receptor [Bacteroidales bacterium]|nr:TonB-dependent receptor [Bacteroidales bacterium]
MKPVAFFFPLLLFFTIPDIYAQFADSTFVLDEVKVSAYQVSSAFRSIPGSISVITGRDFQESDNTQLFSVLNSMPGVTAQSGTYTTNRIVIRGMGSRTPYNTNRIRFYLDDIPLTSSDGLSSPEEIEPENTGRIEIVKGPSSALYGSGLGGSINVYTPDVNENNTTVNARYGSFNTSRFSASHSFYSKNSAVWSSLANLHSQGWRDNSTYDRSSLLLAGKGRRIDFLFLLNRVNSELPSSLGLTLFKTKPGSAAENWKKSGGFKKYVRAVAGIAINSRISDKTTNKFILFAKGIDSYEKRPFNNLDDESTGAGIREKFTVHRAKSDWLVGFEWITEQYRWNLDTNDFRINRNRENRNHANLYFISYQKPLPGLTVSVAGAMNYIRYRLNDLYPENGDQSGKRNFPLIVSPRFGVNYNPIPEIAFYASAGHGFSLPSPDETLLPQGDVNRNIKHEKGWQIEAGTRLNLVHNRISADIAVYRIDLSDLLVTKRLSEDVFTGINAGKTRHYGIELSSRILVLQHNSFPGNLSLSGSFTRSMNHFLEFSDNGIDFKGNILPGIPACATSIQLEWLPVEKVQIAAEMKSSGKQYLNDANTLVYGSYSVLNARVNVQFTQGGKLKSMLYAGLNNITDSAYASMLVVNALSVNGSEPRYFYPGMPRNLYAGLSVTF